MKIEIIGIGKDKDNWVKEGSTHFEKLLKKYCQLSFKYLNVKTKSSSLSPTEIKRIEAVELEKVLSGSYKIALIDRGKSFDTPQLSNWLEKTLAQSSGKIQFIIGGAYGLDESIIKKADLCLSLSPLTFSHQLVRLVLLEQLFRVFSVLHNTDYHK